MQRSTHPLIDYATVSAVAANAALAERQRTLPAPTLEAIARQDLFRVLVPESLGGRQLPLPDALRLFEAAARVDGSFGWAVAIGAGPGVFAPLLETPVAQRCFGHPGAVVAGSGAPAGVAHTEGGGYRVSGRWRWCSGATWATQFTFSARLADGDGVLAFALPPGDVTVHRDWDGFGLTATASHTVEVRDRFVPSSHSFRIGSAPWCDDPLYRLAFRQFAETSFASVMLGLAGGFVDAAEGVIDARAEAWSAQPRRLEAVRLHTREARAGLELACSGFHAVAEDYWRAHCGRAGADGALLERVSLASLQASRASLSCAQGLYPWLGMAAVSAESPLNRAWRDLHTASQHLMISPLQFAA